MSDFDDAVFDLVSGAPPAPDVDVLRARIRRHRRRRAFAVVAVVTAVGLASAGAAASLRSTGNRPTVAVSPTTEAGAGTGPWCVPVSREAAIARVMGMHTEVVSGTAEAKLVSYGELATMEHTQFSNIAGDTKFWAVMVRGTITPSFDRGSNKYAWGLFDIDAHTGDFNGMSAGPGPTPSSWDSLVDHSAECPTTTGRTSTTTEPVTTTTANPRGCGPARDCLGNGPAPTSPPCNPNQTAPTMNGSFCGPVPGPGNGLGPQGECSGRETAPPCGPGMVAGKYYEYTLPGRCDGRLIVDGRRWMSELPPSHPVPDMYVWVRVDGDHAGFISPSGSVGFDLDHGQPAGKCTSP